ncbi:hypothetical protein IQ22_01996 [Pseudomonas duriflava]|uniref:Energy transducer TonB n=1 Tax=Pseudomonas duriflava TaxID=459528 RepID=A0A562QEG4_9PSED|nr:energy transducer TonB [Pseudomonas duriflava]TWI55083.1 hypothetical protein IQ22_01996 [Pseudomonas duriflava]
MMAEARRRAYLRAMQVDVWLPRMELPFAAPSRPELLSFDAQPVTALPSETATEQPAAVAATPAVARPVRPELPKISQVRAAKPDPEPAPVAAEPVKREAPPRFTLQLLRAGGCLLLVDLPTGASLAGREPAYILLRNMLRAAGLPDSPQAIGEPIRWPILAGATSVDQGPAEARSFVQSVVASYQEQHPSLCLWLMGSAATRFAADEALKIECQEARLDSLGSAWIVPGLEALLEEPRLKADVWQAMKRLRPRWTDAK